MILSVISVCYSAVISNALVAAVLKGMQAGVAALIVDFIVDMTGRVLKEKSCFWTGWSLYPLGSVFLQM